jgi:hypothetical protein
LLSDRPEADDCISVRDWRRPRPRLRPTRKLGICLCRIKCTRCPRAFHSDFNRECHERLTSSGEIWSLENGEGASEDDLRPFIEANPHLQYVGRHPEPLPPRCFWML